MIQSSKSDGLRNTVTPRCGDGDYHGGDGHAAR
eukprot:COSAG06_NODE_39182_length_415_cov_1.126582_1_plen_32_part_10